MQNSLTVADEYWDELLQSVNDSIPENKEQWLELIDANPHLTLMTLYLRIKNNG